MKKGKASSVSCVQLAVNFKPEDMQLFHDVLRRVFYEAREKTEIEYETRYVTSKGAILTEEEWKGKYSKSEKPDAKR